MYPLHRSCGTTHPQSDAPLGASVTHYNNALEAAEATLNSLRSVLATNAAGPSLVTIAQHAAKAELTLFRFDEAARNKGYRDLNDAIASLKNKS